MYQSGMTAQGCWDHLDEYDRTAIMTLAELIVKECIKACEQTRELTWTVPLKDDEQITACVCNIIRHFELDNGPI